MEDRFGHRISYLRVSITDRCNERCRYCMPEEQQAWLPREGILSYEEMERIIRVGVSLGVTKVRVTGGEPLTRRDAVPFIERLTLIDGLKDVSLSTNGTLLAKLPVGEAGDGRTAAQRLAAAGLKSVNISLDTLDAAAYAQVTGRDYHADVIAGIDAALAAGIPAVKLNCVLMRNQNEAQLVPLIEFAHARGCLLRFIELMPVSTREMLTEQNFLSAGAARKIVEAHYGPLQPCPDFRTNGPASYSTIPGRDQKIGFIGAMTNLHFCESCNKLRLTADGKLRPCLGSHLENDVLPLLRSGADDAAIARAIRDTVDRKPKEHDFRENYQPGRRMVAIGG